jgi:predicted 2-oxoglutarate/Fe(II)-dependent dioxygenase YbiX
MDIENFVMEYKNIVPKVLIDEVMSADLDFQKSEYANQTGKVENSDKRVNMDEFWIHNTHKLYEPLKSCFVDSINKYITDHPFFSVQHLTDFRINRYKEGGFMSRHYDSIHHSHGQHYGYPHATVLLYLNDDYEGGQFIVADKKLKPIARSAVVFPSNFMYPHEAEVVTKGTRWSIVSWLM